MSSSQQEIVEAQFGDMWKPHILLFMYQFQISNSICKQNLLIKEIRPCATRASPIRKSFAPPPVSISLYSHIFKFQIQNSKVMTPTSPTCSFKTISNPNVHSNFKFRWAESTDSWSKGCKPRYLQLAIMGDEELNTLIKGTIAGGGAVHGGWWRRYKRFDLFLLFTTYFVRSSHLRISWHSSQNVCLRLQLTKT